MRLTASKSSGNFPPPPVPGNELLIPITSWEAMYAETRVGAERKTEKEHDPE